MGLVLPRLLGLGWSLLLLLAGLGGLLTGLLLLGILLLLLLFLLAGVLLRLVLLRHFRHSFRLAGKQGLLTLVSSIADERRLKGRTDGYLPTFAE